MFESPCVFRDGPQHDCFQACSKVTSPCTRLESLYYSSLQQTINFAGELRDRFEGVGRTRASRKMILKSDLNGK